MTVEQASDRAAMLADFGVSVVYTMTGRAPVTLQAIYDAPGDTSVAWREAPGVVQSKPQLALRTADLPPGAGEGDSVEFTDAASGLPVRGRVLVIYPDGTGLSRAEFELAS